MQILTIPLAIIAIATSCLATTTAAATPTGSGSLYDDYNYCQGINPSRKTYKPMNEAVLEKVQVLFRHGDRTPSSIIPGDNTNYNICNNPAEFNFLATSSQNSQLNYASPFLKTNIVVSPKENVYASGLYWRGNCEVGQLTNRGVAQTRQLGKDLRSVYVDQLRFLSSVLDPKDLYLRNTYIWRTRESIEGFLDGFYPVSSRRQRSSKKGHHDDQASVLTLNTYPQTIETLILNPTACPKLGLLYKEFFKTPRYAEFIRSNYALMVKVNKVLGVDSNPAYNTTINGDTVMPRYCNGLPLGCSPLDPKFCLSNKEVVKAIKEGTFMYSGVFREDQYSAAEEIKRLAVGPILKTLSSSIRVSTQSKDKGQKSSAGKRFEIYSAHDQSLDQILAVIATPETPWPAYASSLIIEVWKKPSAKKKHERFVRVLYEGKVVPANQKLGCRLDACPLENFLQFIESYIPKDMAAACRPF